MAGTKSFTVFTKFAVKNNFTGPVLGMAKSADKLAVKAEQVKAGLGKIGNVAAGVGKGMMAVGGVAVAAGAAVFALAKKSADAADDIQNTAAAIGLTTDALQEYRYLGIQAGMTTDDMDAALSKLTVNLGKNYQEVDAALYQIGLSAEGLKAAGPEKTLEYIAQGFQNTTDPAKKAAVATSLFGKSSIRMVNALSGGAESVKGLRKEAQKIGYVMGGETLQNAGDLNDAMDKLGATATGAGNRLAAKFIPSVLKMVNGLQSGLQPGGKLSKLLDSLSNFGGTLTGGLGPAFDKVMDFLPKVIGYANDLWKALEPVVKPILGMLEPVMKIIDNLMPLVTKSIEFAAKILEPFLAAIKSILDGLADISGGSASRLVATGAAAAPGQVASALAADPSGAARAGLMRGGMIPATPMSPQTAPLATSSSTTTTSKVVLSVAPGVNAKQDKPAPGVTLNPGQTSGAQWGGVRDTGRRN